MYKVVTPPLSGLMKNIEHRVVPMLRETANSSISGYTLARCVVEVALYHWLDEQGWIPYQRRFIDDLPEEKQRLMHNTIVEDLLYSLQAENMWISSMEVINKLEELLITVDDFFNRTFSSDEFSEFKRYTLVNYLWTGRSIYIVLKEEE